MKNIYNKLNLIFIIIFVSFFFSFPAIKNSLSKKEDVDYSLSESLLISVNNDSNIFNKTFSNLKIYFLSRKLLQEKIDSLQNDIDNLKYDNVINNSYTNLLKNNSNNDFPILTKKIFQDFTSIYNTVLLDKGFVNSVEEGDIVFIYPDKVIGEISNINSKTSIMSLYSKSGNKLQGVLNAYKDESIVLVKDIKNSSSSISLNSSTTASSSIIDTDLQNIQQKANESLNQDKKLHNIIVEVVGVGSGDFTASVPDNIVVSTGTIVYLATDNSKSLGEIVKIENEEASFYKTLFIKGYYNTRSEDDYYISPKSK